MQHAKDDIHGKILAEQREIDEAVDKLIPQYLEELEWMLMAEFGKAIMLNVDMENLEGVLERLARAASSRTMAITSNKRLDEERANVGGIFRALVDVSLGKKEGSE